MSNIPHSKEGVWIGVRDLVICPLESDGDVVKYSDDIHHIPGTIEIGLTPNMSSEPLGADDNEIWELLALMGSIDVTATIASLGTAVESLLMGRRIDANGVLIAGGKDNPPWVALGFKAARSDGTDTYIWLYKGKFKPDTITFHTKEQGTVNWNTPALAATFGKLDSSISDDFYAQLNTGDEGVSEATKETFFDTVYLPKEPTNPVPTNP